MLVQESSLKWAQKRALTVFASQILEENPHLALNTNHPKQGGITSFLTSVGALALAGRLQMSRVLIQTFFQKPLERVQLKPISKP